MEKPYAEWKWCDKDQVLTTQPCELIYAVAVTNDDACKDNILYDGKSTKEQLIVNMQSEEKSMHPFAPPEPVFCKRGLYLDFGTNTEGVFVMWRNLPRKTAES